MHTDEEIRKLDEKLKAATSGCCELTITLKDSERSFRKKFLCYDPIQFTDSDPIISAYLKEVMEEFKGQPEKVTIKASMEL